MPCHTTVQWGQPHSLTASHCLRALLFFLPPLNPHPFRYWTAAGKAGTAAVLRARGRRQHWTTWWPPHRSGGGLATHAGYAYKQKNGKCKHAKVRLGEVRLGEVRLGEVRLGEARLGEATIIGIRGYYQVDYYGWLGLLLVVNAQPTIAFVRGSYPSFQTYTDGINSDAGCAATGMVDHSVLVTKGAHTATHGAQWRAGVMMQRRRGIYNDAGCAAAGVVDHSVLVMGYSITAEGAYWILRNSWGATWGMQGYMQMAFGGGIGICGIHSVPAIYPIVKIISLSPSRSPSRPTQASSMCLSQQNPCGEGTSPSLCLSLQNQYGVGGTCEDTENSDSHARAWKRSSPLTPPSPPSLPPSNMGEVV
ncbi:unnamed protein product, partial [Closterium sp. NIES-64]